MPVSPWFFILEILAGFIGGLLIGFILLFIYGVFANTIRKWRRPKDKRKLADPGPDPISEKEVAEIKREQYKKFREYEKLRRHIIRKTQGNTIPTGRSPETISDARRDEIIGGRGSEQEDLHRASESDNLSIGGTEGSGGEEEQKIRLPKRDD